MDCSPAISKQQNSSSLWCLHADSNSQCTLHCQACTYPLSCTGLSKAVAAVCQYQKQPVGMQVAAVADQQPHHTLKSRSSHRLTCYFHCCCCHMDCYPLLQDMQKNVRREVSKLKLLLQQYAILTGQAQLFASDQAGKAARTTLVSTGNSGKAIQNTCRSQSTSHRYSLHVLPATAAVTCHLHDAVLVVHRSP